jgi:hypothetical protein
LELEQVELATHKVETQHLVQTDNRFIWLHMAEAQHKEMGNQVHVVQEQITFQELAQAEAVKDHGKPHGALAEAAEALEEQDHMEIYVSKMVEDTQDITAEVE